MDDSTVGVINDAYVSWDRLEGLPPQIKTMTWVEGRGVIMAREDVAGAAIVYLPPVVVYPAKLKPSKRVWRTEWGSGLSDRGGFSETRVTQTEPVRYKSKKMIAVRIVRSGHLRYPGLDGMWTVEELFEPRSRVRLERTEHFKGTRDGSAYELRDRMRLLEDSLPARP